MTEWTGLSGSDLIDEITGTVGKRANNAVAKAAILRYLNISQNYMFRNADWPELLLLNQSITTDGSFSYDLSSSGILTPDDSGVFGRVVDRTMRTTLGDIEHRSRRWIEKQDPQHNNSGRPGFYTMEGNELILFPYGSGETVYFDILIAPAAITATIAATAISFDPLNHDLILEGGLWQAFRRWGKASNDWAKQRGYFMATVKKAARQSGGVRVQPHVTKPQEF